MSEGFYVGVDGGGTKTIVSVCHKDGTLLGEGHAGCTNWNSVGNTAAFQNLQDAIQSAVNNAGIQKEQVTGICLGVAGVGRPEDKAKLQEWVKQILPQEPLLMRLSNDAEAACASGTGGSLQGICTISGTGTICMAFNNGKECARAAGWGALLGDQGSGFDIGINALRAVTNASDRGEKTPLLEATLKELGLAHPDDLVTWAYQGERTEWSRFAGISKVVSELAAAGEEESKKLLNAAASSLVATMKLVHKKAGFTGPVNIVLSGGNFTHSGGETYLTRAVTEQLQNAEHGIPEAKILLPSVSISVAAVLILIKEGEEK